LIESAKNFKLQAQVLKDLLEDLAQKKKKVVGYGATSKSSTILNYAEIGPELIAYIIDSTVDKQGKISPGKHIPIVGYDIFDSDKPDYVILFAWNHKEEIFEKEVSKNKEFSWMVPFPMPNIIKL